MRVERAGVLWVTRVVAARLKAATCQKPALAGVVTEAVVGAVLSTAKVALGPAAGAVLPARSVAVPVAMEMPRVPSPLMPERVTVRVLPLPVTATVALAVPVVFSVML